MHKSQSLFYLTTALHVSGVTITHLQEHKTTVTTASGNHYTVLLSAAIVEELGPVWVCCGWRTPPTTHSNRLHYVASLACFYWFWYMFVPVFIIIIIIIIIIISSIRWRHHLRAWRHQNTIWNMTTKIVNFVPGNFNTSNFKSNKKKCYYYLISRIGHYSTHTLPVSGVRNGYS